MAVNTETIRVDLNTGREMPVAHTHQNDTNRQFVFKIYNNGVPHDLSGFTAKFGLISPRVNGQYFVISGSSMASGTVSGNTVTVTLPEDYNTAHGVGLLTLILTSYGKTIRPINIKYVVQRSADGLDAITGASDFPTTLKGFVDNWFDNNSDEYLDAWLTGALADQDLESVVNNWLDDHPEATTTVLDGSLTEAKFSDALKLKTIKDYVTPEMFGAVGDGVTDDKIPLINAIDYCASNSKTLLLSKTYLITSSVLIETAINIVCKGVIEYSGNGTAITIGTSSAVAQMKKIELNVKGTNLSNPAQGSIGVSLINLSGCIFDISTNSFDKGVVLIGDSGGFQNNIINIGYIYNSDVGLTLRSINSGWVNSNTFIGGKIGISSSFTGTNKIGVYLNDSNGLAVNNNVFLNTNLESLNVAIQMGRAIANEFIGIRVENTVKVLNKLDNSAVSNVITPNFGVCSNDLEIQTVFSKSIRGFIYDVNIDLSGGASNANWFSCSKIIGVGSGFSIIPFAEAVTYGDRKITVPSKMMIGVKVNVQSKYIYFDCDADAYSLIVVPYSGNTELTGHINLIINNDYFGYYDTTSTKTILSKRVESSSIASGGRIVILPDECDNVALIIRNASNDVTLSNIKVSSLKPLGLITLGNANYPVLLGAPTSASPVGTFVMSYAPTAELKGWLMTENGWITV